MPARGPAVSSTARSPKRASAKDPVRLWSLPAEQHVRLAEHDFAWPVSDDVKNFATSLSSPFCGGNHSFEAAGWLEDPPTVQSLAMIPLRHGDETFGLLVLGSPDPTRYSADMGTMYNAFLSGSA